MVKLLALILTINQAFFAFSSLENNFYEPQVVFISGASIQTYKVVDDYVLAIVNFGEIKILECLDKRAGTILWTTDCESFSSDYMYSYYSEYFVYDGKVYFAYNSIDEIKQQKYSELRCVDIKTGKLQSIMELCDVELIFDFWQNEILRKDNLCVVKYKKGFGLLDITKGEMIWDRHDIELEYSVKICGNYLILRGLHDIEGYELLTGKMLWHIDNTYILPVNDPPHSTYVTDNYYIEAGLGCCPGGDWSFCIIPESGEAVWKKIGSLGDQYILGIKDNVVVVLNYDDVRNNDIIKNKIKGIDLYNGELIWSKDSETPGEWSLTDGFLFEQINEGKNEIRRQYDPANLELIKKDTYMFDRYYNKIKFIKNEIYSLDHGFLCKWEIDKK